MADKTKGRQQPSANVFLIKGELSKVAYQVKSLSRDQGRSKVLGNELPKIKKLCKQANESGNNISAAVDNEWLKEHSVGLIKISFTGTKDACDEFIRDLPVEPSSVLRVGKKNIEVVYVINRCSTALRNKIITELSAQFDNATVSALSHYLLPAFHNHRKKGFKVKQISSSTDELKSFDFISQFDLDIWPKPKPLVEAGNKVMKYQKEFLPILASRFILDGACSIGCVPDYIAIPFVTLVASLMGHKIHSQPTPDESFIVAPIIWGMVIGEPGTKKSPASSLVLDLLKEPIDEYEKDFNSAKKKHKSKDKVHDVQLKLVTEQVKCLIEEANNVKAPKSQRRLFRQAERLFQEILEDKFELVKKRLITSDVTFASLHKMLRDNPNGLLLYVDEIIGLLSKVHRKGNEELKAYLLQCFNGFGVFEVDRATTEHQSSQDAILSVFGTIQPDKLRPFIEKVIEGKEENDGFFNRFNLITAPELPSLSDIEYKPMDAKVHAKVQSFIISLCEHEFFNHDDIKKRVVTFSYDAEELYLSWWRNFQKKVENSDSDSFKSHCRKYQSLVPKLALINQVISSYSPSKDEFNPFDEVEIRCVEQAIAFTEYLESHARKLFDPLVNITLVDAQRVSELLHTITGSFVRRDICQRNLSGIRRDSERAQAALDLLEKHYWIKKSRHSRKTQHYVVNPQLSD